MLALAKALMLDPDVLLIDELSLGLAPSWSCRSCCGVVERLKAEGITMVIVEQSVNVALAVADRAVFMERGQVRFEGPAQELLDREELLRAVFLERNRSLMHGRFTIVAARSPRSTSSAASSKA